MSENVLSVKDLSMSFGGLKAVDSLSFHIKGKEILGLIGPNGAGKTTVFNCITQFYKNYEGIVILQGANKDKDLREVPVHKIIDYGIARTFQNLELIPDTSVMDNVLIGAHKDVKSNIIHHILQFPSLKRNEKRLKEKAERILAFLGIDHLKDAYVHGQPYGIMKLIEIGRALMGDPSLLILDEPAAGLNEKETKHLEGIVKKINEEYETAILLIEHNMGFVMDLCNTVIAINFGRFLAQGTPKEVQSNKAVQEAYLGEAES